MSKQQIVLTILGVGLIIVLFSLPKVVVDNDSDMAEVPSATQEENAGAEEIPGAHEVELSDSDQQKIQYFKEQLKNPNNSAIFADSLANTFLLVQQLDSVAKYADLLAEVDPSIEAKEKAGNYYYEAFGFAADDARAKKLGSKVQELLGEVLKANPDNLSAKSKIAMTYISSPNPMQGILMLREILEKEPDNKEALYNMGILSMQSAQYDKAVERLEKLLTIDPENIQAMFYLGVSYKELGDKQKAKAWLIKAKETENDPAVSAAVDSYLQELN